MDTAQVVTLLLGVCSIVFSPLIAYQVAARRLSGKISTSEASDLWKESSDIRADYRARLREADEALRRLRDRIDALERENIKLHAENDELRAKLEARK